MNILSYKHNNVFTSKSEVKLNISYYAHWSVVRYAKDGKVKRQGRYKYICRVGSKPYEVVRQIVVNNIDKWKQERSQSSTVKTVGHLAEAFIKLVK